VTPLLSVRLTAEYQRNKPVLRSAAFEVFPGEILGLVGQSGSGKSTIALSILRLLPMRGGASSGPILFRDRDLSTLSERDLRHIRGKEIGFVSQSPATALNPAMRLGAHLQEAWRAHSRATPDFPSLLTSVSLPNDSAFLRRYPTELSIGQGQRFLIAMGILHHPALLLTDEPTSALDVITQAEILRLFSKLRSGLNMAILYISHDLLSVANLCDRVAILQSGQIVETGPTAEIFQHPQHPYTQALVAAIPNMPRSLTAQTQSGPAGSPHPPR
jgi:ABC-type dipeptide/oligopeptide/nickel transport system ATPase component